MQEEKMDFVPSSNYEGPEIPQKYDEATDLDTEFLLMKGSAEGEVKLVAAITDVPVGVNTNKPKAGQGVTVRMNNFGGRSKVKLSGTVAHGDYLQPAADATATKAEYDDDLVFGIARQAGVADDVISFDPMPAVYGVAVGLGAAP
jgi:hypothetical protein